MNLIAKIKYKTGLLIARLFLKVSRLPACPVSPSIPCQDNLFLISSTINCPKRPGLKSVFDDNDRLEQTINTIASIRINVPNVFIALVDNSVLLPKQVEVLKNKVDLLLLCGDDPQARKWSNSPNKGSGEVYAVMQAMNVLKYYNFKMMYKICGRYELSEQFNLKGFSEDKFSFCQRAVNSCSTILYSFPKTLTPVYMRQLNACMCASAWGVSIEAVIDKGLGVDLIHHLSQLGIQGLLSQTGDSIDY